MLSLVSLGWTEFFSGQIPDSPDSLPARVSGGVAPTVLVHDGVSERTALVPGRLRTTGVVVGDWVLLDTTATPACVTRVLERRSAVERQAAGRVTSVQTLAANVDLVLLAEPLDRPPSPRRLERLIALAWSSGAEPVVLLTKADLHPDAGDALRAAAAFGPGVAMHAVVSSQEATAALLRPLLAPGRTAVLVGPSGSGKSTLTNCLLGADIRSTGAVRGIDGRGRHTTTDRRLFPVPGGGALIDTPGIRELALWAGEQGIESVFPEIAELAERCRFRDCRHAGEPGCAVADAVDAGLLDAGRVAGMAKLQRELEVQRLRQAGALRQQERQLWRPIHKAMRKMNKK
jgi:ribosome biogenesis GTPase / thiamine phosphate phosphatase